VNHPRQSFTVVVAVAIKRKMKTASSSKGAPSRSSSFASKLRIRSTATTSVGPSGRHNNTNTSFAPNTPEATKTESTIKLATAPSSPSLESIISSLGTGFMGRDGRISFVPSPKSKTTKSYSEHDNLVVNGKETTRVSPFRLTSSLPFTTSTNTSAASSDTKSKSMTCPSTTVSSMIHHPHSALRRISWSFVRVADLEMDHELTSFTRSSSLSSTDDQPVSEGYNNNNTSSANSPVTNEPNIHHAAVNPPPGVEIDPKERWIALTTDTDGSHAPIAPIAMDRLANFGLTTSLNEPMWIADSKTDKLLKRGPGLPDWMKATFKAGKIHIPNCNSGVGGKDDPIQSEVLVWSGSFKHGLYGSDLPAIRAAGIVHMSAKALMELLVDSTRVKEYNKLSLGRQDLITFDGDLQTAGPFGTSITKVMKSETRPPIIRKSLVFVSILHAKELVDGSGYLIVTRAVHHPEEEKSMANAVKSEILMGVNLIRKIDSGTGGNNIDNMCLLINVNHIRSPLVPMMVAKRIGVTSAVGFMNDIRSLC
jgi:hypothetical protein